MIYRLIKMLDKRFGMEQAKAHCDIPCGIYDPITAQIAALTVVRMIDLMNDLENKHPAGGLEVQNSMGRYVASKEVHAEKAKHEIRVIWGDYIKPQHMEKNPELHDLVHKIMALGSKSRQTADRETAVQFVGAVNEFAEIFWETKGIPVKRAKAPYPPALEMVYPDL
jgi:nickel superoxide dismutase